MASLHLQHSVCVFVYRVPVPGMETHIPVLFLNLKRMSVFVFVVLLRVHRHTLKHSTFKLWLNILI